MFADAWDQFIAPIPEVEHGDMISACHRRLVGGNEETKLRCARAWCRWEMVTSRLIVDPALLEKAEDDKFALASSRIETHYFVNGGFLESENALIDGTLILREHRIPAVIVQGRYDVECPFKSAWDLHKAWPESELVIVADAVCFL